MSWLLAAIITAGVCAVVTFALRGGDADEHGYRSLLPSMFTLLGGLGIAVFYFGLDWVLASITDLPAQLDGWSAFPHTASVTVCVAFISFYMAFTGLWSLITTIDGNQRMLGHSIDRLRRELDDSQRSTLAR